MLTCQSICVVTRMTHQAVHSSWINGISSYVVAWEALQQSSGCGMLAASAGCCSAAWVSQGPLLATSCVPGGVGGAVGERGRLQGLTQSAGRLVSTDLVVFQELLGLLLSRELLEHCSTEVAGLRASAGSKR